MAPKPSDDVGWVGVLILAVIFAVVSAMLVYSLVVFWPSESAHPTKSVTYFSNTVTRPSVSASLFLLVIFAGAIGGTIHSLRSLYWYVGNRTLKYSWLLMYFSLPFIGALMATVTYLILRGGLTSTFASSSDINPYGFASVAGLVGLFSREAAEKLRKVFETLLTTAETGRDPAIELSVTGFDPKTGPAGTTVTVTGTGLTSATSVSLGGAQVTALTVVSDERLTFDVPTQAAQGRSKIVVTSPAERKASADEFDVT